MSSLFLHASITPCASPPRKSCAACLDVKERRGQRGALYVIDEASSSVQRQIFPGPLIVNEEVLPDFRPRVSGKDREIFFLTLH